MYFLYDYINPTIDRNMCWRSVSLCTSNLVEALENWQNRLHEVSMRRCARITRSVRWLGDEVNNIPTYEGFPSLASFKTKIEAKFTESQRLSALDFVLKATPTRWWGTHKQSISKWLQCRSLLEIIFG